MSKEILDAIFFGTSNKPRCPKCLAPINETSISDYGVLDDQERFWFVSLCSDCGSHVRYKTDFDHCVVPDNVVEKDKVLNGGRKG